MGVSTLMANSFSQSDVARAETSLAKSLAPEDVCVGDYVAPLHERYDFPSFFWCSDAALADRAETVTIRLMARGNNIPLKVKAVCLPFVLVKHPLRGTLTLDVRRYQLARLDPAYAALVIRALKRRKKKPNAKKRKNSAK